MVELSVEHVLLFVIAAFLLYYLMGSCGCRNGFRVGGKLVATPRHAVNDGSCPEECKICNCVPPTKLFGSWVGDTSDGSHKGSFKCDSKCIK
jgi:hypothetical protein